MSTARSPQQQEVLDACHGLAAYGLGPGIGGHVSVRVPGEERYWTNRLSKTFEEMELDDIVELDFEGRSVDPDVVVSPGIDFHHGIYQLRPDVGAICHSHGFWITAQSAYGREPRLLHNMATYFHDRTAIAPDDDIASIAPAMKDDDVAIIIPWHGSITVGKDIGDAAALHVTLDYACRLDVTHGANDVPLMPEDHAEAVKKLLAEANYLEITWDLIKRKAERGRRDGLVWPVLAQ